MIHKPSDNHVPFNTRSAVRKPICSPLLPAADFRAYPRAFASLVLIALFTSVGWAESRFSLEGQLNLGTDMMDIALKLSSQVASPDPLEFRTWSHLGGTNNAGDVIAAGGFDPTLALLDGTPTQIAFTDDGTGIPGNFDSLLSFTAGDTPIPSPLAAGDDSIIRRLRSNGCSRIGRSSFLRWQPLYTERAMMRTQL